MGQDRATSAGARRRFIGTATPPARCAAEWLTPTSATRCLGLEVDADAAAGLEAGVEEASRQGIGGAVPLGERHGTDIDHAERSPVTELGGHAAQMLVHQHDAVPREAESDGGEES